MVDFIWAGAICEKRVVVSKSSCFQNFTYDLISLMSTHISWEVLIQRLFTSCGHIVLFNYVLEIS